MQLQALLRLIKLTMVKMTKTTAKKNQTKKKANPNGVKSRRQGGINPKVSVPRQRQGQKTNGNSTKIFGQDFLQTLTFQDPTDEGNRNVPGAVVVHKRLNPIRFPGSRLSVFAPLFQKFRFTKFDLKYVSAVPSTTAGQMVACFDNDPTWAPTGSPDEIVRAMMAHKNRKLFHPFDNVVMSLPKSGNVQTFYNDDTGQDIRLNNQAGIFVTIVSPVVNLNGEQWNSGVGGFWIDWEIEFFLPRISKTGQLTFSNTCVLNTVSFSLTGNPLWSLVSGAQPPTQTSEIVVVAQPIKQGAPDGIPTAQLPLGTLWYLGSELMDTTRVQRWLLYSSMRGAQNRDPQDQITFGELPQRDIKIQWESIGPAVGVRVEAADTAITLQSPPLAGDNQLSNLFSTDPTTQGKEIALSYTGMSGDRSSPDTSAAITKIDPSTGEETPLTDGEDLIVKQVDSEALQARFGLSDLQMQGLYGIQPGEKAILSILITAIGWATRVIGVIGTVVKIAGQVKRTFNETEQNFLNRVQIFPAMLSPSGFAVTYNQVLEVVV